jgi:hypothetical protein
MVRTSMSKQRWQDTIATATCDQPDLRMALATCLEHVNLGGARPHL